MLKFNVNLSEAVHCDYVLNLEKSFLVNMCELRLWELQFSERNTKDQITGGWWCHTWQIGDVACVVMCWMRGWESDKSKTAMRRTAHSANGEFPRDYSYSPKIVINITSKQRRLNAANQSKTEAN